jgi:hypothetical protein
MSRPGGTQCTFRWRKAANNALMSSLLLFISQDCYYFVGSDTSLLLLPAEMVRASAPSSHLVQRCGYRTRTSVVTKSGTCTQLLVKFTIYVHRGLRDSTLCKQGIYSSTTDANLSVIFWSSSSYYVYS